MTNIVVATGQWNLSERDNRHLSNDPDGSIVTVRLAFKNTIFSIHLQIHRNVNTQWFAKYSVFIVRYKAGAHLVY